MKKPALLILILLSLGACKDEINVITSKQPGKIVGNVLPQESDATVKLIQGEVISETITKNGVFKFEDVPPGIYRLSIKAKNFGKQEIENVKVEDGEGNDVGVIQLSKYPYPLISTTPFNGETNVSTQLGNLYFEFSKEIVPTSLERALEINPKVIIDRRYSSNKKRFTFYTSFKLGTKYEVTLDTNVVTEYGEHLEFPVTFTFTTLDFALTDVRYPQLSRYSNAPLDLFFNGKLLNNLENMVTVEPDISVEVLQDNNSRRNSNSTIRITPTNGWMADTSFNIIVSKSLEEINGATLERDTTISFTTPKLEIVETFPSNNQYYIDRNSYIKVETNYILDEGSIKDAISISPNVDFQITTSSRYARTVLRLSPSQLSANTKYTITINKSLTDVYGVPLREDYVFSFTTKE